MPFWELKTADRLTTLTTEGLGPSQLKATAEGRWQNHLCFKFGLHLSHDYIKDMHKFS